MLKISAFSLLLLFALTGCPQGEDPPPIYTPPVSTPGSGGGISLPGGSGGTATGGAGGGAMGGAGGSAPMGGTSGTPAPAASARFFLPTGETTNTAAPTVELDGQGSMHLVYPAYFGGSAFYATCGKDCSGPAAMKVVRFATEGSVANTMLALDGQGRPRVLLSAAQKLYYASCDRDCGQESNWRTTMILDHQGDREVTGEALALDPQGRPRFMMHTYRAYLGIGQKTPETFYVRCDAADCHSAGAWQSSKIATQIWESASLRFDATGRGHLAFVATVVEGPNAGAKLAGYALCERDCEGENAWAPAGLMNAFTSETDAVRIGAAVSLALTAPARPRVLVLGKTDDGQRSVVYFECDHDCTGANWHGSIISNHAQIGAGLDLALDRQGHPRVAYTVGYNIGLAFCDDASCVGETSKWDLTKVELGSDLPKDDIILWPNCTIDAWFLHSPSIALTAEGSPRVGYQARDVSGGFDRPDPTRPRCRAGTDMTFSRFAVMPGYR